MNIINIYFPPFFWQRKNIKCTKIEFEKVLREETVLIEKVKTNSELFKSNKLEKEFILDEYDNFKFISTDYFNKKFKIKTLIYPIYKKENTIIISLTYLGGIGMIYLYIMIIMLFWFSQNISIKLYFFLPLALIYFITFIELLSIRSHILFSKFITSKVSQINKL